jgi:hypothetical protein
MISEIAEMSQEQMQGLLVQAVTELKEKWVEYNEF